jgi:hypothetical protein
MSAGFCSVRRSSRQGDPAPTAPARASGVAANRQVCTKPPGLTRTTATRSSARAHIETREDFVRFGEVLGDDLRAHPTWWENNTHESYLGALAAVADSLDQGFKNQGQRARFSARPRRPSASRPRPNYTEGRPTPPHRNAGATCGIEPCRTVTPRASWVGAVARRYSGSRHTVRGAAGCRKSRSPLRTQSAGVLPAVCAPQR